MTEFSLIVRNAVLNVKAALIQKTIVRFAEETGLIALFVCALMDTMMTGFQKIV
jgi:hypothetical protein